MTKAIPEGETRKDRRRQWILGLGVVVVFVLLSVIVGQQRLQLNQQTNYHASSIAKSNIIINSQREHASTLTQIHKLAMDIDNLVALVPATKTALVSGQNQLIGELAALCAATHASCPGIP